MHNITDSNVIVLQNDGYKGKHVFQAKPKLKSGPRLSVAAVAGRPEPGLQNGIAFPEFSV